MSRMCFTRSLCVAPVTVRSPQCSGAGKLWLWKNWSLDILGCVFRLRFENHVLYWTWQRCDINVLFLSSVQIEHHVRGQNNRNRLKLLNIVHWLSGLDKYRLDRRRSQEYRSWRRWTPLAFHKGFVAGDSHHAPDQPSVPGEAGGEQTWTPSPSFWPSSWSIRMLRHSSRDKVCEHCAFMLYILYLGVVSCCVDGGLVGFFHGSGPGSLRLWFHCIVQLLVLKGWSQMVPRARKCRKCPSVEPHEAPVT